MKRSNNYSGGSILLAVLLLGLLIASSLFLYFRIKKRKQQEVEPEEVPNDEEEENPDALVNFYKLTSEVVNARYPDTDNTERIKLLVAQAAHETGDFTSEVMKNNNNAFGMKHPKMRTTTSLNEKNGYANYSKLADSIEDRLLWDEYNKVNYEGMTPVSFVQSLNKLSYFEDVFINYKNAIVKWYKVVQSEISRG